MSMKNKALYQNPPDWVGVVGAVIGIIIMSISVILNMERPAYPKISFEEFLVVLYLVLIHSFKSHVVEEEYFVVKLFGMPLRKVPWYRINSAVYVPDKYKSVPRGSIVITLHPSKPYVPNKFELINPIRAIRFYVSHDNKPQCIDALRFCLGEERVIIKEYRTGNSSLS